ncbi:MAG: hypothetical protein A2722_03350 [Candidatus Doudnabacteria bacterium RIFCSPHIGHO2_01_FULL_50_11]|uniref:Uncharacterized protein n=1 Tax=Candidatus Doudnabacteria bacterium RIFCSPHIGHO2_01_FULL_50_11 TaxID=1817828 RepID=A0A1F5PI81_9BACT|nr:MAG: hypothetical protein A2722_03350 [Candidatus Doudnabacteria bacterium RIFCSPHIGHO2_01_FULL_50_11]HLC44803.1 hypothetical protein [Patescibacteria group bacterium]
MNNHNSPEGGSPESEHLNSSRNGTGHEGESPHPSELEKYQDLTREQSDELINAGKRQIAQSKANIEKGDERLRAQERELEAPWRKKIQALESIEPTGDTIEDAKAYFAAVEFDPSKLDSPDSEAYVAGDRAGMLDYFRDLVKVLARHTNPPKKWTWIGDFEAKDEEVVRNIIRAAEALEKK